MPSLQDVYAEAVASTGGLVRIDFNLTPRCNLNCIHCYRMTERTKSGEILSTDEVISLLERAAGLGAMWTTFSGGEPLLRPDLAELLSAADALGFAVAILTNGTLLDEHRANLLADYRVWQVQVTLMGGTAEVHDRVVQVPGSFKKAVRGIERLLDRGVTVDVAFVGLRENWDSMEDLWRLCDRLGVRLRASFVVTAGLGGDMSPLAHVVPDKELRRALRVGRRYHILLQDEDWDPVCRPVSPSLSQQTPLCNAAHKIVGINWDGTVWPCIVWPLVAGDIRTADLAEIWRNSPVLNEVRRYHDSDRDSCVGCRLRRRCMICPARSWLLSGQFLDPDEQTCRVTHLVDEIDRELASDTRFLAELGLRIQREMETNQD